MRESDLYAPCVAGMLADGCAVHKIGDGSAGEKPAEIMGASPTGLMMILELKAPTVARASSLQWELFESHQRRWLRGFARRGSVYLAGVYDRKRHVIMVWKLRHTYDACAREPDYELGRTNGIFRGWPDGPVERVLNAEQLGSIHADTTEETESASGPD